MNIYHPRSTLVTIVALMALTLLTALSFAVGETEDNSEAQATVEREVATRHNVAIN